MTKYCCAKYFRDNKERLQKIARERYHSLSKEEKEKKPQNGRKGCKKFLDDEKQRQVGYGKKNEKEQLTIISILNNIKHVQTDSFFFAQG